MDQTTRQNLVMAFNNVLRTSALVGTVDLQRAGLAFSMLLEQHEIGPLELQPLYEWLRQNGGEEDPVAEVLVFMKSREHRFGISMDLPPNLATLPKQRVDEMILAFTSRGATSGTRTGAGLGNSASGTFKVPDRTSSDTHQKPAGLAAPPPLAYEPAPSKSSGSSRRALYVFLGVVVLAGVINAGLLIFGGEPAPVTATLKDSAGLTCTKAIISKQVLLCDAPPGFFKQNSDAAVTTKATITLNEVKAQGAQRVMVFDADHKLRKVVGAQPQ